MSVALSCVKSDFGIKLKPRISAIAEKTKILELLILVSLEKTCDVLRVYGLKSSRTAAQLHGHGSMTMLYRLNCDSGRNPYND